MFLSIITRCYKRPTMLAALRASLEAQTCQDFEHVFMVDSVGVGVAEANKRLANAIFEGQYVYVLDDDNEIIDPDFVAALKQIAAIHRPDVIMIRSHNCELGVLPWPEVWGNKPVEGRIDMMNFVVTAEVYRLHSASFDGGYCGDFRFIDDVFRYNGYNVYWHDRIMARAQRRSRGEPE